MSLPTETLAPSRRLPAAAVTSRSSEGKSTPASDSCATSATGPRPFGMPGLGERACQQLLEDGQGAI